MSADPVFEALWSRVLAAWDDDRTHAALIEHAVRSEQMPEAAGRYRALLADPERSARAQKQLDAIVAAATALLFAQKTPAKAPGAPRWVMLIALLVALALFGMLAWAMLRR